MSFQLLPFVSDSNAFSSPVVCVDGDIRLVNSPAGRNDSGRLEICVNEDWPTVCDMGWAAEDASVACIQLGFSRYGETLASLITNLRAQNTTPPLSGHFVHQKNGILLFR